MPRIEQHPPLGARYNVSIEELTPPDELEDAEDDCVWSVVELPPIGTQELERRQIAPALSTLIRRYLDEFGFPRDNEQGEEVFGQYSVGEFPCDREMRFFIDHPTAIGPELVRRIQAMLAERFPLWRIVPQYRELVLGVYPDGLRIGERPDAPFIRGPLKDDDPYFLEWTSRVRALAEDRLRDHLRGET